jgi:hypothetical protein
VRVAPELTVLWRLTYAVAYRTGRTPWDTGITPPEVVELIEGAGAPAPGRALEKIDDGTYGLCDRCGRSIPEERLEARPWSTLCVSCASLRS